MSTLSRCLRCFGPLEPERAELNICHCLACECKRPTVALNLVIAGADGVDRRIAGPKHTQPRRTWQEHLNHAITG